MLIQKDYFVSQCTDISRIWLLVAEQVANWCWNVSLDSRRIWVETFRPSFKLVARLIIALLSGEVKANLWGRSRLFLEDLEILVAGGGQKFCGPPFVFWVHTLEEYKSQRFWARLSIATRKIDNANCNFKYSNHQCLTNIILSFIRTI